MKKLALSFVVVMLFVGIGVNGYITPGCSVAGAEEVTVTSTPLGTALNGVINGTVLPVFIAFMGGLVSLVLLKLKKKLNMQLLAETEEWIQNQAENVVQMVAEKAAARIKFNQVTLTKNIKLDMAIASLVSKIPNLSKEQADAYIHAALARIPGIGATGDASLK